MPELKIGLVGTAKWTVTEELTASRWKSGMLDVFATPALVALMECAASEALQGCLQEGTTSVGVGIDLQHTAATAPGGTVEARAELVEIDRRALSFEITAFDQNGQIGAARHKRMIVDVERFLKKLSEK